MSVPDSRVDYAIIADFVPHGARVLDVGCGDGTLLALLEEKKQVDGRGLELSQDGVNEAVARGLSVVQGDADTDLATYPDRSFDVVILSQTLQATQAPKKVLEELLRIGKRVIVTIPNFGNWRARLHLLVHGTHAGHEVAALFLVRHAEHPFLHAARLSQSGRRSERDHRRVSSAER
jgi:methionine biosynthesis protein MetW